MAEGFKMLSEALDSDYRIHSIVLREDVSLPASINAPQDLCMVASKADFQKISAQVNPEGVLIVLHFPNDDFFAQVELPETPLQGPAFVLAGIQDPGNLGTIIRTADWFGMKTLICGPGTTDCFNPKVLRSSMGSLFRLKIIYIQELETWLQQNANQVWLADMEGASLAATKISEKPFVLLGNEAGGVSTSIRNIQGLEKVTIPKFGAAESLNAATAAAIFAWKMRPNIDQS